MYEHYSSVQKLQPEKTTPVSRHFTQKNHSVKNMDGGSNKPKCHHQAQVPITILYLGIPYTPPCRQHHVCMRLCPLIAPLTQVHPPPPLAVYKNILLSLNQSNEPFRSILRGDNIIITKSQDPQLGIIYIWTGVI